MSTSYDSHTVETVEAQVKASLERAGYAGGSHLLVVAVSGGPDSLALLHSLLALREWAGLRLHVAHLNHDFRGEVAEEDARFVARVAGQLGLPATVEKADPMDYQKRMGISSFEDAAREIRYQFLAGVARDASASAAVLGHTADDLAETVLMHIIRGSGVHGLRGMVERSTWSSRTGGDEVALFRPLLGVTKRETVAYCQERGILFREDPSNLLMRFTRNRVRHELLPAMRSYNPRIDDALVRLARSASLEVDYLEQEVGKVWTITASHEGNSIALDAGILATVHPLLQRLVLRQAYGRIAGDTRRLEEVNLRDMADFIGAPPGKVLDLPRGIQLSTGYDRLFLGRPAEVPCPFPPLENEHELNLPTASSEGLTEVSGWSVIARMVTSPRSMTGDDTFTVWLDPESLGSGLTVRTRLRGDRFRPLGMHGEKKLQDFYVDEKVPRTWRDRVPLVVTERGIAWVVGYRVAEWARVIGDDRPVLQLRFAPLEARPDLQSPE